VPTIFSDQIPTGTPHPEPDLTAIPTLPEISTLTIEITPSIDSVPIRAVESLVKLGVTDGATGNVGYDNGG
jgi:hypothetical protein